MVYKAMKLTPYQRWQQRTKDGTAMSGGWVVASYPPKKRGEYLVRGNPRSYLTWAYGHWWYMPVSECGSIPYWRLAKPPSAWKRGRCCDNTGIHGADLLLKAVELGSEEAETELRSLGWKGDYRPYAGNTSWRH